MKRFTHYIGAVFLALPMLVAATESEAVIETTKEEVLDVLIDIEPVVLDVTVPLSLATLLNDANGYHNTLTFDFQNNTVVPVTIDLDAIEMNAIYEETLTYDRYMNDETVRFNFEFLETVGAETVSFTDSEGSTHAINRSFGQVDGLASKAVNLSIQSDGGLASRLNELIVFKYLVKGVF